MSRLFASASDHLDVASATITAVPFTFFAWIKMVGLGSSGRVLTVGTSAANTNLFALLKNASDQVSGTSDDGAASTVTTTATIADTTTWHAAAFSSLAATNRTVDLDGLQGNTNVNSRVPTGINAMRIGSTFIDTQSHNGYIAHVAIWNVILTQDEQAALLSVTPDLIRPSALLEYWPLTDSSLASLGTSPHTMVATGSTVSTDNPLFPATAWLAA